MFVVWNPVQAGKCFCKVQQATDGVTSSTGCFFQKSSTLFTMSYSCCKKNRNTIRYMLKVCVASTRTTKSIGTWEPSSQKILRLGISLIFYLMY